MHIIFILHIWKKHRNLRNTHHQLQKNPLAQRTVKRDKNTNYALFIMRSGNFLMRNVSDCYAKNETLELLHIALKKHIRDDL